MATLTASHTAIRTALNVGLGTWGALELALRLTNRASTSGSDWTYFVMIASIAAGINIALGAAGHAPQTGAAAALATIGLIVLAAGAALRIWSILTLGRLFTFVVTIQSDHEPLRRPRPLPATPAPQLHRGPRRPARRRHRTRQSLSAVAIVLLPLTGVLIRIPFEEARLREGLGASDD